MINNDIVDIEYGSEDIHQELRNNKEQLDLVLTRGELTGSNLMLDFYRSVVVDGKKYRTHAILVDVMEEAD